MAEPTTFARLSVVILDHLDIEPERMKPEARFTDDLGADSLDYIELLMAAEEAFNIEISDDAAEGCDTVFKAVVMIDQLIAQQHPEAAHG